MNVCMGYDGLLFGVISLARKKTKNKKIKIKTNTKIKTKAGMEGGEERRKGKKNVDWP